MSDDLILHELTGSPNNVKARIGLGYKGLEYERKPFRFEEFPGDRSGVLGISRQPRLPVLQHGRIVIFDSAAILRYLEANFPDSPPIFVDDYAEHGQIEQWELFAKTRTSEPIGMVFEQAFAPTADSNVVVQANRLLHERTGALEDRLSSREFLVGDHLTAADIACASSLYLADMTEQNAASSPIAAFFRANLRLGEGRERTRAWVRRVMAYDKVLGQR